MGVHATVRGCGRTSIALGALRSIFSVLVALARFFPMGRPFFSGISTWPRWREKFLMSPPFFRVCGNVWRRGASFGDFAHTRALETLYPFRGTI
jgi:hypothetical protein